MKLSLHLTIFMGVPLFSNPSPLELKKKAFLNSKLLAWLLLQNCRSLPKNLGAANTLSVARRGLSLLFFGVNMPVFLWLNVSVLVTNALHHYLLMILKKRLDLRVDGLSMGGLLA